MRLGIELSKEDVDWLESLWDGHACNASTDDFLKSTLELHQRMLIHTIDLRAYAAISGAMRWPWSQESRILQPHPEVVG